MNVLSATSTKRKPEPPGLACSQLQLNGGDINSLHPPGRALGEPRRRHILGVTAHSAGAGTAQQARNRDLVMGARAHSATLRPRALDRVPQYLLTYESHKRQSRYVTTAETLSFSAGWTFCISSRENTDSEPADFSNQNLT